MRRYLLLEGPRLGGGPSACSVMFYSLLLSKDDSKESTSHMHLNCFSLGEILAILSGLSIALPISLRTSPSSQVADWETEPAWNSALNLGATFVTSTLFLSIITSCVASLFSTVGAKFTGMDAVDLYLQVTHAWTHACAHACAHEVHA